METNPQMFLLGNQPMPVRFAGKETFKLSDTSSAYSYMLVSSDTSDGLQELFLYQKKEKNYRLLAKRKLPFSFSSGLAQKITSILFQHIWYCRQNPDTSLEGFLNDFSTLFVKTERSILLMKELAPLCTQPQISYEAIYQIICQLLDKCEWNQQAYQIYISKKMKHHPMRILYKSNFVDWMIFCQLTAEFLSECREWKEDNYPMLSFYCCGSAYQTALTSCIHTQMTDKDRNDEKQGILNPGKDTDIFQQTEKIFQTTHQNLKGFSFRITRTSYETQIIRSYTIALKETARQAQAQQFPLYAETALCLPKDAAIHTGKWKGTVRTITSADGAEEYIMPAPLSEEFAALVASGKAKILSQTWSKRDEGWVFSMQYTYQDRTAENPYRPAEKYYSNENLIFINSFPEILVKQKKGQSNLSILAKQSEYSVGMSNAILDRNSLKLEIPEKLPYHYMLYFKIFDSKQRYLGQFDCDLTPAEGGNES